MDPDALSMVSHLDGPLLFLYILVNKIVEAVKAKYEHIEQMARINKEP